MPTGWKFYLFNFSNSINYRALHQGVLGSNPDFCPALAVGQVTILILRLCCSFLNCKMGIMKLATVKDCGEN